MWIIPQESCSQNKQTKEVNQDNESKERGQEATLPYVERDEWDPSRQHVAAGPMANKEEAAPSWAAP